MKLKDIAEIIAAKGLYKDIEINWLLTDSRSLTFPDETLFFALRTQRNDGHDYIPELYRQNVRYFVVSELRSDFDALKDAIFLKVDDTLLALQRVAAAQRKSVDVPIIGITGSNGKTIVKEWLYQLLHTDYSIVRSPRSYNSQIGVPLSVWALNQNTQLGIFEAGISEVGEMEKLEAIIEPTIGIFTYLGEAHQINFQSIKQKCEEKLQLFKNADVLIYNSDDKVLQISVAQSGLKAELLSWGTTNDAVIKIIEKETDHHITHIALIYKNETIQINLPFVDEASIQNVLHCVVTMLYLGISSAEINTRISLLEPVAMRLELKKGVRNCLIINDSYNSDLNSLSIALNFLDQQAATNNLSKTLVLSDILQSGMTTEELYSKVSDLIKNKNIQKIIGIGSDISKQADKFSFIENEFFNSTESFLKSGSIFNFNNEIVLLKGSRKFQFETISSKIELIAHETVLEVNLNALVDNLNYFRTKLKPTTKVMCMVKAFAYGSGATEVARTLQHHRCDYLAVAVADEGAELRDEGIRIPIVVMNPEMGSLGVIFDHNLEPEVYGFRLLDALISTAEKLGLIDYPVHLKIDSGMHRLGFERKDIPQLIQRLQNQKQLKIRSVFSHLAGADEAELDEFSMQQINEFSACADQLSTAFPHYIMRHILNSAGAERLTDYQFDMVRLGIGLYGISSIPTVKLSPVCSLKTVVLQIKEISAGETVGYSRKGKVEKPKKIAILPVGYADGFDRKLSNGVGQVLVNGKRAKVIGNVSMDLITVDVTGIEVAEGDIVEVFGDKLSLQEVANWLKTIPYEILTSISRRVKRIYFQE